MKSKIQVLWILFLSLFLFSSEYDNIYAAASHWIYGNIRYTDGTFPSDLSWRAYITIRHTDVITDHEPTAKYHHETGGVEIQLSDLYNNWSPGETFRMEFQDTHGNPLTVDVVLTNNPSDNFGTHVMARTKAKLTLKHYMESWGRIEPVDGEYIYNIGQVVEIKAYPAKGYRFKYWSENENVANYSAPFTTVTMYGDQKIDCVFSKVYYTLTMESDPPEGGVTDPPTGEYSDIYNTGDVVPLTATPNPGYRFVSWSGNVADSTSQTTSIVMLQHETVTARFEETTYTLNMNVSPQGGGTSTPTVGAYTYDPGTVVNISAVAEDGYHFVNWTGDVANPNNPNTTVTMNGNKDVTANFAKPQVTLNLSVSPAGSGTTVPAAGQYSVETDSVVTLQAIAGAGYQFVNWTGDVAEPNNPNTTVTMTGNKNVSANFARIKVTLNLSVSPAGSGTTVPGTGQYSVDIDSVVTIQAIAGAGYQFVNWTGDVAEPNNPNTTVIMTGNKNVTANFSRPRVTLNLSVLPPGFGMTVPSTGQYSMEMDSVVTLQAIANEDYYFVNWTGDVAESNNPSTTVVMTGNKNVTANFEKIKVTLNLSVSPAGKGTTVPAAGQYSMDIDSIVTLQAIANAGYQFVNWTGDVADSNNSNTTVTMSDNKTVTANFERIKVTLTMSVLPKVWGTTVPAVGQYTVNMDSVVTLQAIAGAGYQFVNWTGDVAEPNNPNTTVTMTGSKNVTANFEKIKVTLNLSVLPSGSGTTVPSAGQYSVDLDSVVTLQAIANEGYRFVNWTGDVADSNNSNTTVTMTGNKEITANFESTIVTLTISVLPEGSGTTVPSAGQYSVEMDSVVTLQAIANEGYRFVNWTGDVADSNNSNTTVTMTGNKEITANFESTIVTLTMSVQPEASGTTLPAVGQHTVDIDSVITIEAVANERYYFVNWTGDVADSTNPNTTVTMTGNKEVKANFAKPKVTLNLSVLPVGSGTTVPPAGQYSVNMDSVVTIQARAVQGYRFLNWTGSVTNPDSVNTTVTMDSSKNIIANFVPLTDVVVTTNPGGLRMVVDSTLYFAPQVFSWVAGSVHTIGIDSTTQNGSKGIRYLYGGWSDNGEQTHQITAGEKFIYTANFNTQYFLFTNVEPAAGGGIVPAAPGAWYDTGRQVTVTAIESPETGYVFWEWNGDLSGSANPDTVVMDTTKSVTARFAASDAEAPVLSDAYPANGTQQVPRNTSIQFKLQDNVSDINPASLQFHVNDFPVVVNGVDQTSGFADVVFTGNSCTVYYHPVSSFDQGDSVVVNVKCEDSSPFKNALDSTFSFKIGASRIVYTKRDTVDQSGGVVYDDSTGIAITIPENAVADTTEITINVVDGYPELPPGKKGLPLGVYFEPAGLQFADSVTITIPYNQANLDSAGVTDPLDLKVYYYSGLTGEWITLKVFSANEFNIYVKVKEFCYLVYGKKYLTLSKPGVPAGQTKLLVNTLYGFETSKVISVLGHVVEYRFDWGDGFMSSWSQDTTAAHKWTNTGKYGIVAFARSIMDSTQKKQSDTLYVTVTDLSAIDQAGTAPITFALSQNYPNPFNPQTSIKYQVPKNVFATLEIYNISGQKIRTLVNEEKMTGYYTVIWDGKDDFNMAVSSGLYFLQMKAGDYVNVIKMSFLK